MVYNVQFEFTSLIFYAYEMLTNIKLCFFGFKQIKSFHPKIDCFQTLHLCTKNSYSMGPKFNEVVNMYLIKVVKKN